MSAATAVAAVRSPGRIPRWALLAGLALLAAILYLLFAGQFPLPHDDDSGVFHRFNDLREWIDANRNSNPLLVVFVTGVRLAIDALYAGIHGLLAVFGWLGLTALATILALLVGGRRLAILVGACFVAFGLLGLWPRTLDTLALTLTAVALSLAVGIPLGVVAGRSDRFLAFISPVLDVMQIMPTYAYLAPVALFFLIGTATAAIVTMVYAIPPAIRITALGIRGVAPASVEAATSMGSTRRQLLAKVQLPMARRTIVLGINQTIMMALSMVVITVLVDAPGLGKNIIGALQQSNVGMAFDAGVAVVLLAVVLDRLTSAASERVDPAHASREGVFVARRRTQAILAGVIVAAVAAGWLLFDGTFVDALRLSFRGPVNVAVEWLRLNAFFLTDGLKTVVTLQLINPIEGFLVGMPWWGIIVVVAGIAYVVSGARQAILATACLVLILRLEIWEHSMATLAQVLVATFLTLAIGLVLGIWAARSDRASRFLRPGLDAAQTMPAFVYLIPAVALFGPTRFTAIVAALIYAVPAVIRLVEVGVRAVPATVREAAISAGSTPSQLLLKVELPLARPALLVAANQGIILVLAMVVVGGLVGGGALGYDVVAGFARRDQFGEGLAAAIALVLLGILLDRITQGAGRRKDLGGDGTVGEPVPIRPA